MTDEASGIYRALSAQRDTIDEIHMLLFTLVNMAVIGLLLGVAVLCIRKVSNE